MKVISKSLLSTFDDGVQKYLFTKRQVFHKYVCLKSEGLRQNAADLAIPVLHFICVLLSNNFFKTGPETHDEVSLVLCGTCFCIIGHIKCI